ncbi:hypothetical protein DFP73DRAFT_532347 [Morchella snyderi]|nr:hypothetical protein DFP73DRAFT_532347 [Morchella snyderi]
MDPNDKGRYSIGNHTFHSCMLAPPSGNFAHNYVRYTHNEFNATKYMIGWTIDRVAANGPETSGNFFVASHGILVEGATNTLIVWQPKLCHGTTLSDIDPAAPEPGFRHTVASIALSKRLAGVWEK